MGIKNFALLSMMVISVGAVLTGCASDASSGSYQSATQLIDKPIGRAPDVRMHYQLTYGNNPALKRAYAEYLKTGKAPNVITEGFVQFAYGTGVQPVIAGSPLELTVISLEPGEKVTNISSGDQLRWSYSLAYSGQGDLRQAHVMIKPAQAGISTDLVIATDKRMYTLKITTVNNGKYVRDVRFWYPEEVAAYWNKYNESAQDADHGGQTIAEVPNVSLNNLNFNYRLYKNAWHAPSWTPTRVFDDGTHTFIQFPAIVSSRDMPVLFVLNGKSKDLVNYRVKGTYFVVDKIFQQAMIVSGTGSSQSSITISNGSY